jgi:hypothetical protein
MKHFTVQSVHRPRITIHSVCDDAADSRRTRRLRKKMSCKMLLMARRLVILLWYQVFGEPRLVLGAERWEVQRTACVGPHVSCLHDASNSLANPIAVILGDLIH